MTDHDQEETIEEATARFAHLGTVDVTRREDRWLAIAAAMALGLGVVGIYGVMAYVVSQRTREIGIRLALGAQPTALKRMFVLDALARVAIGIVVGLVAAFALTRLMSSLLFGIGPLDAPTYLAALGVLLAAAAFASYVPARRAASIDPVETLKAE